MGHQEPAEDVHGGERDGDEANDFRKAEAAGAGEVLARRELLRVTLEIPDAAIVEARVTRDVIESVLLAHVGAIAQAMEFAKNKNQPITRIWIDGGFSDALIKKLVKNQFPAEKISGLVLRGVWAWLETQVGTD